MLLTAEGSLYLIGEPVQRTERLTLREFAIQLDLKEGQSWPEYISFELINNRAALLNGFQVGDRVQVEFTLTGRPYQGRDGSQKFGNRLNAVNVRKVAAPANQTAPQTQQQQNNGTTPF